MSLRIQLLLACVLLGAQAVGAEPETVPLGAGGLLIGVPGAGPLTADQVRAWLGDPANHRELAPELPIGLDEGAADLRGLEPNPLTRAKIELGRQLFFDPRLSRDGSVSCASCHEPGHGYASASRFSVGVGGRLGVRNSPTAANRILSTAQFWDGRAASLEEQAVSPMVNPVEMAFTHDAVVQTLGRVEAYRLQFRRVFGLDALTIENAGRALAAFERALVSGPSPWDHHRRLQRFERAYEGELNTLDDDSQAEYASLRAAADAAPLSAAALRGGELFFGDRAGCTRCHAGANFTDERYHNLGVGADAHEAEIDWGRYTVTGDESDRGAFKTPGLRNVAQTAPYMHDGSQATLAEVVAWYVAGGQDNPNLDPLIEPLDLDDAEQTDLVEFLKSLTGAWPEVETDRLPD